MERKYARIDNGKIAEFFETDGNIADIFHPSLIWVDVTGQNLTVGMIATEGGAGFTFTLPTVPLDTLKADKVAKIKAAAATFITGGVECDALGVVHTYPTAQTDQINLNGLISKALIEGEAGAPYKFWCTSVNGIWARRDHTAAQIKSVGVTVAAHVIDAQNAYADKLAAIAAATSEDQLNAIAEAL